MRRISAALALLIMPGAAGAEPPLSAIDWLKQPAPITVAQPLARPLSEPPVADGVSVPDVTVMPLENVRADAVGLLPGSVTGLPRALWVASATGTLVQLLGDLPDRPLPAIQALYYTLLLAEADPPGDTGADARFLRARIDALRRFGAVEAALALIERAGPETPALFDQWLDLALLTGTENAPCAALAARPELSTSYANRIFCIARAGDWPTAALTFDSARALGALSPHEAALLAMFLDPETADTATDLPPPRDITPLIFRLYEAVGAPLPTRNLPREFAVADLRGTMGWRAEIEAAERLARTGAVPANRLLGLYTERRAAASGGVWQRVRAIQAFDAAMAQAEAGRIAATLPTAWRLMREQGLAVAFATLYGERLADIGLDGAAGTLALEVGLLSPAYERIAGKAPQTRKWQLLQGLARGAPDPALAQTAQERAIAAGFAATRPAREEAADLAQGRIGQAILSAAARLDRAEPDHAQEIETALATLRAVGLEDVARRAALQLLLLPRRG